MPLGTQQNNDFAQVTIDVWNDKVFYQDNNVGDAIANFL